MTGEIDRMKLVRILTILLLCAPAGAVFAQDVASDPDEAEFVRLKKHFE